MPVGDVVAVDEGGGAVDEGGREVDEGGGAVDEGAEDGDAIDEGAVVPDVGGADVGVEEEIVGDLSVEDGDDPREGEDTVLEEVGLIVTAVPVADGNTKTEQEGPAHDIP